jgi:hypothetical protein
MHLALGNAFQAVKAALNAADGLVFGQTHLEDGADQGFHADLDHVIVDIVQIRLELGHVHKGFGAILALHTHHMIWVINIQCYLRVIDTVLLSGTTNPTVNHA